MKNIVVLVSLVTVAVATLAPIASATDHVGRTPEQYPEIRSGSEDLAPVEYPSNRPVQTNPADFEYKDDVDLSD
jgi:hypothetical protein